jgi:hypothetical protein
VSNTGFPKIANAGYTHMKPNPCPLCAHCYQGGGLVRVRGFTHVCGAKHHILSAITTEKGRCADYEPADNQRIPQKDVDEEITQLREWKVKVKAYRNE